MYAHFVSVVCVCVLCINVYKCLIVCMCHCLCVHVYASLSDDTEFLIVSHVSSWDGHLRKSY